MNMKKTIAAVAAASVAVSAMATTASALEAKTLTYNLVREAASSANVSVTVTATFTDLAFKAGQKVVITAVGNNTINQAGWGDSFVITGSYWDDDAGQNKPFTLKASRNAWNDNYTAEGDKLLSEDWADGGIAYNRKISIPVAATGAGTETALRTTTSAQLTVSYTYTALDSKTYGSIGNVNEAIAAGNLGLILEIREDEGDAVPASVTDFKAQGFTADSVDVSGYTSTSDTTYTYSETADQGAGYDKDLFLSTLRTSYSGIVELDVSKYTGADRTLIYKTITKSGSDFKAWVDVDTGEVVDLEKLGIDLVIYDNTIEGVLQEDIPAGTSAAKTVIYLTTEENDIGDVVIKAVGSDQIANAEFADFTGRDIQLASNTTILLENEKLEWDGTAFKGANITLTDADLDVIFKAVDKTKFSTGASTNATQGTTIKLTGAVKGGGAWSPSLDQAGKVVKVNGTPKDGDSFTVKGAKGATGGLIKKYPVNATTAGGASKFTAGSYIFKPFKTNLNTAVFYESQDSNIIHYLETNAVNGGASAANKAVFRDTYNLSGNFGSYLNVTAVLNDAVQNYDVTFKFNTATQPVNIVTDAYDSDTSNSNVSEAYMAFGQHLYPLYDFELTTFTGMDWSGTNLFAGALVVNGGLTMSLANTEYFDWTQTSISFSWDDIVDAAATKGITNDAALYIRTMGLATSQTWYWDSLDVILALREEDDASADAGVIADGDVLDDEGDDIEIDDTDVDIDIDIDETPETEAAPVVTEAAPAVTSNPKTGNASVALAVIPVALAAAAVVAKKRG